MTTANTQKPTLRIRLTRVSNDRHRLELIRDSGDREQVELETRSLLVHDLIHYAVESVAGLSGGVWGILAAGKTLADLNDRTGKALAGYGPELSIIELVTGALTRVLQGQGEPERALFAITAMLSAQDKPVPAWLSVEFIERAREKLRQLLGCFSATRFGQSMELAWP